jgi:hypothetical protein
MQGWRLAEIQFAVIPESGSMCGVRECTSTTLILRALAGKAGASDNSTKGGHLFEDPALFIANQRAAQTKQREAQS